MRTSFGSDKGCFVDLLVRASNTPDIKINEKVIDLKIAFDTYPVSVWIKETYFWNLLLCFCLSFLWTECNISLVTFSGLYVWELMGILFIFYSCPVLECNNMFSSLTNSVLCFDLYLSAILMILCAKTSFLCHMIEFVW